MGSDIKEGNSNVIHVSKWRLFPRVCTAYRRKLKQHERTKPDKVKIDSKICGVYYTVLWKKTWSMCTQFLTIHTSSILMTLVTPKSPKTGTHPVKAMELTAFLSTIMAHWSKVVHRDHVTWSEAGKCGLTTILEIWLGYREGLTVIVRRLQFRPECVWSLNGNGVLIAFCCKYFIPRGLRPLYYNSA